MIQKFPFKELFFEEVKKAKGMANCHAHLDRAYTLTPEIWKQASALMEEKWVLNREIKRKHTKESLTERLTFCIEDFIKQGITACRTHVDADSIVGMLVVDTAAEVREKYKGKFTLQLVAHPLEGFLNEDRTAPSKEKMDLFEKACAICDVVGGLPSRDRNKADGDKKHMDFLISMAKNFNKDIDMHVDQENNPEEKDSEWILDTIEKSGMQGRVTFVHAISVAAQMESDRKRIYKKMAELGVNVTVCPKAAISMKQHKDKLSPLHNSIAQVDEMLEHGINVSLGTDNISDIFVPEDNGDLFEEVLMLASAVRFYDIEKLAQMATTNGLKTMKLNQ
ncbi:MAG: amidohydrolase family protein [Candidatus Peregrinibacteria bacterium]|nr:amidohydrolase family protein [Candidatus Peregrinibacteria bacterium]